MSVGGTDVCVQWEVYTSKMICFEEVEGVKDWKSQAEWPLPRPGNVCSAGQACECIESLCVYGKHFLT